MLDPGSFRDWDSRVFYENGRVLRALSDDGLADWRALAGSTLFARGESPRASSSRTKRGRRRGRAGRRPRRAAVLEHERIPFVSYPYEWPFSMLKDAALLQLDLLERALAEDLTLKDSTPYNVQWRGSQPVFIDVGSFERLEPGSPWSGYRQFCMLFLYPLLLQAYKGIAFQPWLRGRLAGIPPTEARALMSFRDLFRRGVPDARRAARPARAQERRDGARREAGAPQGRVQEGADRRQRARLRQARAPARLEAGPHGVEPSTAATTSYTDADAARKEAFVREVVHSRRVGARLGHRLQPRQPRADRGRELPLRRRGRRRRRRRRRALPLAARGGRRRRSSRSSATSPTRRPRSAGAARERRPLEERGKPDLVSASPSSTTSSSRGNVPVAEFLSWLQGSAARS